MKPCAFCVEKHVGTAYALLRESEAGYKGRVCMAIGELRLADEECSEWPQTQLRIRYYRKQLEQLRKVDLEPLVVEVESIASKADPATAKKPCGCKGEQHVEG